MSKNYHVPFSLIEDCILRNQLNTLYYYYRLRHLFKNRVVYDFSYAKIARLLNVSKSVSHKHVNIMLKEGWCTIENGHLRILGINALLGKFDNRILITVPVVQLKKQQIIIFRYAIIYKNLRLQWKMASQKSKIVKICNTHTIQITKSQNKLMSKLGGSKKIERTWMNRTTLSNRSIGKKLNRSERSGANYQKQFRENELLWSIRSQKIHRRSVSTSTWGFLLHYAQDAPNVGLSYKNAIVSRESNTLIPRYHFRYRLKKAIQANSSLCNSTT